MDSSSEDDRPRPDKPQRPDWLLSPDDMEAEPPPERAMLPPVPVRPPRAPRDTGAPTGPPSHSADAGPAGQRRLPDFDEGPARASGWVPGLEMSGRFMPPPGEPGEAPPEGAMATEAGTGQGEPAAPDVPGEDDPSRPTATAGVGAEERAIPAAVIRRGPPPAQPAPEPRPPLAGMALELARRHWRWGAGIAVSLLLAATIAQAIGIGTTPVGRILAAPTRFDGARVKVRGRVGDDVFPLGGGYSFFLLQGRDSVVVFTRFRQPQPHARIALTAQVSTGTLGSAALPALLELDPRKR